MESMKRYDKEFKKEVIRKYMAGESIAGLARETGVGEQTLHKWKNELVSEGEGEADKDLLKLRRENRELRMEVEILKKAAIIFGRGG